MDYRAFLGAAAIISTSFAPIATTAAWADDGDGIILTPLTESDATPQQVCEDVLRPRPNRVSRLKRSTSAMAAP